MAVLTVTKNTYEVEPLYQWDKNQVLEIHGLSLASIPEIHFANDAMDKAIVRQSNMDNAGIITVDIPNSLLQKPYKIKAYVCTYDGDTFETQYKMEIPVKPRKKPNDYTLEDDLEVYSFNALENKVNNIVEAYGDLGDKHTVAITALIKATADIEKAVKAVANCEINNAEILKIAETCKTEVDKITESIALCEEASEEARQALADAQEVLEAIQELRVTVDSSMDDIYEALNGYEKTANKTTSVNEESPSTVKYPSEYALVEFMKTKNDAFTEAINGVNTKIDGINTAIDEINGEVV